MADHFITLPVEGSGGGTGGDLDLNGLRISALSSALTINDNQVLPADIFIYSKASYEYCVIEYSLSREGEFQVGRLFVANNTLDATITNDFASSIMSLGVTFSVIVDGALIRVQYVSTSTGFSGVFKFSVRQWI